MKELYLDNAASTPVYPEVVKDVTEVMINNYGNPGAIHKKGEEAFILINNARKKIAYEIGCKPEEIVFNSGASESNNLALIGLAKANPEKKKIIISSIEHPSIREVALSFKESGYKIVEIPVNNEGLIDLDFLEKSIDKNTLIVSVIHANNVFGTIQNIKRIGELCKSKNVLFHTDAVQSFGKLNIDVRNMNIDLLSASGHKIGAPKGIGLLYVRRGVKISPIILGGGQENGLRSGTENVSGIVGLASALEMQKKVDSKKVGIIRDYLIEKLEGLGGKINGSRKERLWNNVHVLFSGINGEGLVLALSLKGIYVSTGSACESKKQREDYVLKAIGLNKKERGESIRITLGKDISMKEIDWVIREIKNYLN